MAVRKLAKTGQRAALFLAIAAAGLPGAALADPEDGGRGGWRGRSGNAEAQGNVRADGAPQRRGGNAESRNSGEGYRGGGWRGGPRSGWQDSEQARPAPPPASARPRTETRTSGEWNTPDRDRAGDRWRDSDQWRRDRDGYRDRDGDRWRRDAYRGGYGGDYRRWDNRWRESSRYNWYGYRRNNPGIFRMRPYYAPYRDYSYRRLSIGFFLDTLFFGSNFWINDPWQYRLPDVYGPYRWVRYYDDALLVNVYNGEVVDVIYSFFW